MALARCQRLVLAHGKMPPNPQGDQGMSMLDGVSQCLWPSKECVVWWDAWAAAGSLTSVAATVILGFVTYRLGRAANRASQLAVDLASQETKRQDERDRKEAILLLMQITGEVSTNRERIAGLHAQLLQPGSAVNFFADLQYRAEFMRSMGSVVFPLVDKLADRYHYLDDLIGVTLVRAVGLYATLHVNYQALLDEHDVEEVMRAHALLLTVLPAVVEDLEVVRLACAEAVRVSGIDNARIARHAAAVAEASGQ